MVKLDIRNSKTGDPAGIIHKEAGKSEMGTEKEFGPQAVICLLKIRRADRASCNCYYPDADANNARLLLGSLCLSNENFFDPQTCRPTSSLLRKPAINHVSTGLSQW